MKRCAFLLVALLGAGMSGGANAGPVTAEREILARVDEVYANIRDFQAAFTQETRIEGFSTVLTSSGRVYVKKPGLLRWDYLTPSVEQILVEGDAWSMYVPQHQQVVKGTVTNLTASKAPVALLQGAGKLTEQFEVVSSPQDVPGTEGLLWLTLVPREDERAKATVTKVVLGVDPQTYLIRQLVLYEMSGNVSTFRFTDIEVNHGVEAAVFSLTVPDDVIIVDAPTF